MTTGERECVCMYVLCAHRVPVRAEVVGALVVVMGVAVVVVAVVVGVVD